MYVLGRGNRETEGIMSYSLLIYQINEHQKSTIKVGNTDLKIDQFKL